jgi:hypothetical protein
MKSFHELIHEHVSPVYLRYNRALYEGQENAEEQRRLFKKFVTYVEVEVHSFCNRTCWFCPNSYIDRRTNRNYMDEAVYLQMLDDLAAIDYRHVIGYSRYNEPTGDEIIYKRMSQAHERLPKARLLSHTNGDYLNMDVVKRLYDSGLRWLNIQLYLIEKEFDLDKTRRIADRTMKRVSGINFTLKGEDVTRGLWYEAKYGDMEVRMYGQNFTKIGINRGGLTVSGKPQVRVKPCLYPTWGVFIDWDGNVMPCCNVRSDNPEEKDCATGMLTAAPGSIFKVYAGREAAGWRKAMYGFGPKSGVCAGCTAEGPVDTRLNRALVHLVRPLAGPR